MSGELQTIPARHGVATFVPRGRTIKIINTYGKQVVSTWAFSLHAPPEDDDNDEEEDVEEKTKKLGEEVEKEKKEKKEKEDEKSKDKKKENKESTASAESKEPKSRADKAKESEEADDPPEQAPETEKSGETKDDKKSGKRTWASYLPSIPYRAKEAQATESKPDPKAEKAQNEATSKKWSSYLPTGKGFSSYVPNVQMPDSKGVVSAFQSSHYRDPNKSYAEQLYDFSKTPVGAGTIAVASGSGTASSLYAAYSAYTKMNPSKNDQPPMEYLSLPHTRASSHRLVPEVNDTLLTNLRAPIMTLIEDTTPGAHDTLTAACDANQYTALGVDSPEEHGSCAENLVLALKEINEKAGLKGTKAVGADITVNIAPTPLHLFMNAPLDFDTSAQSEGAGAKGVKLKVDEPKTKKRGYVRFRADRDIVVVLSACPMDIGSQNGGRCMAANFMVEDADEDVAASTASVKKPQKLGAKKGAAAAAPEKKEKKDEPKATPKATPKAGAGGDRPAPPKKLESRKQSTAGEPAKSKEGKTEEKEEPKEDVKQDAKEDAKAEETKAEESAKPKKKPKKIERRAATPAKSES
ncbi:hypothetical protein BDV95DRAFT_625014 [Massariosphaeria phaeospora]|uniref:DUF1989 domain-containing protein n=1 Tax=Massariosphaeria phaeospora TaxID=100035 RepID=A0A7C8MCE8_9PLEO|nr:hypothetical protein BDV95DRAFT_625014 [Massariosphaeria phaeospora]